MTDFHTWYEAISVVFIEYLKKERYCHIQWTVFLLIYDPNFVPATTMKSHENLECKEFGHK